MNEFIKKYQKVEVKDYPNQVKSEPLVSVCVQTYQHVNFIKDCLEGILMQKTTFDYEILLGEDESTDGTREICLEYAEKYPVKIRLFLHRRENVIKINGNPTGRFNLFYNFSKAFGKYIALCEGDDYWTDPYKLQKQVDFLEANSDYGLVCSNYHSIIKSNEIINDYLTVKYEYGVETDIAMNDYILKRFQIRTLTVIFKNDFFNKFLVEIPNDIYTNAGGGDFPLWIYILSKTKVRYFPYSTGVYRITMNTASRPNNIENKFLFQKRVAEANLLIAKHLKLEKKIMRQLEIRYLLVLMQQNAFKYKKIKVLKYFFHLVLQGKINKFALAYIIQSLGPFFENLVPSKYIEIKLDN